jgi:hypothetical protein
MKSVMSVQIDALMRQAHADLMRASKDGYRSFTIMFSGNDYTAMGWGPKHGGSYDTFPGKEQNVKSIDELIECVRISTAERDPTAIAATLGINPDGSFQREAAE